MKNKIQSYLNQVGWSTMTILSDRFGLTRKGVITFLAEIRADQDVRIYSNEIVHV